MSLPNLRDVVVDLTAKVDLLNTKVSELENEVKFLKENKSINGKTPKATTKKSKTSKV